MNRSWLPLLCVLCGLFVGLILGDKLASHEDCNAQLSQQAQVLSTLADALKAVVSQTLFKRVDIKGRCAALEILICTPAVRNLIREGKTYQIPSAMQTGKKYGMQTLDDAIMGLLEKGWISGEDAYTNCIEKGKFVK